MNAKAFILLQLRPGTAPLLPSASIKFSPLIQKNYVYLCKLHTLIFYSFFVWLSMKSQVLFTIKKARVFASVQIFSRDLFCNIVRIHKIPV